MGLFDWLFGKEEEPEPEAPRRMTEEEMYDWLAEQQEWIERRAERERQMMQAARERLLQRRAQERRG